jgi:hypothetical protein
LRPPESQSVTTLAGLSSEYGAADPNWRLMYVPSVFRAKIATLADEG